jgi:hypothetical protein
MRSALKSTKKPYLQPGISKKVQSSLEKIELTRLLLAEALHTRDGSHDECVALVGVERECAGGGGFGGMKLSSTSCTLRSLPSRLIDGDSIIRAGDFA